MTLYYFNNHVIVWTVKDEAIQKTTKNDIKLTTQRKKSIFYVENMDFLMKKKFNDDIQAFLPVHAMI